MDMMSIRRRVMMQKAQTGPVDLFNGSDLRDNLRVYQVGVGNQIQLVSSTASKVYAFACPVVSGEQYKIQYTITNPVATSDRQWCISDAGGNMVYSNNMTYPMSSGDREVTLTAQGTGYLWMTMDKNASDIHIYKV